jgi:hypothetical protein
MCPSEPDNGQVTLQYTITVYFHTIVGSSRAFNIQRFQGMSELDLCAGGDCNAMVTL